VYDKQKIMHPNLCPYHHDGERILPPLIFNDAIFAYAYYETNNNNHHDDDDDDGQELQTRSEVEDSLQKRIKNEKCVGFGNIAISPIEHINDYSQEEVAAKWYTENEYRKMRR
jgi:hypothetical protein